METKVNKSETTTKKDVDEWVDGEGKFHRKIVIETITGPINIRDAVNKGKFDIVPGFFRPKTSFNPNVLMPMQNKFTPGHIPTMDEFFGKNMSDKPLIDFKDLFEKGKKILEQSGMKLEDLFGDKSKNKAEEKTAEELVNEVKMESKTQTKPKEPVKQLKIVYNKEDKKDKPLNQNKEVKKCQKNKTTKKNQKKKKN